MRRLPSFFERSCHRLYPRLPLIVTVAAALALLLYGPIEQPAHYHEFADRRSLFGMPNAADVLSNIGFAGIGLWGMVRLWPARAHSALAAGWPGYLLFMIALVLTTAGSSFYHLAPDNLRLVWDRLPIALACAGLLAAVHAETVPQAKRYLEVVLLGFAALASVAWWVFSGVHGYSDLRPYLLLQCLPLVLIPLWQAVHRAPRGDRLAFGAAILLYVAAKAAELSDHTLLDMLGTVSGHTIKHLLATAASAVLIGRLVGRLQ